MYVNSSFSATIPLIGGGTPIGGTSQFYQPQTIDLSTYHNVTKIIIDNITDFGGLAYDNFSFTPPGQTAGGSVPEPASISLMAITGLALLPRRRRS